MKHYLLSAAIGASLLGVPLYVGCDKDKSVKEEVHTNPDGSKTSEKVESKTASDGTQSQSAKTEVTGADGSKIVQKSDAKTDPDGTHKESSSAETKASDGTKTVDKSDKKVDANGNVIESKTEHKAD